MAGAQRKNGLFGRHVGRGLFLLYQEQALHLVTRTHCGAGPKTPPKVEKGMHRRNESKAVKLNNIMIRSGSRSISSYPAEKNVVARPQEQRHMGHIKSSSISRTDFLGTSSSSTPVNSMS